MTVTATFSEVIDKAIAFPEVGAVNFRLLRSFFHALIDELNLNDTSMEYDLPKDKKSRWKKQHDDSPEIDKTEKGDRQDKSDQLSEADQENEISTITEIDYEDETSKIDYENKEENIPSKTQSGIKAKKSSIGEKDKGKSILKKQSSYKKDDGRKKTSKIRRRKDIDADIDSAERDEEEYSHISLSKKVSKLEEKMELIENLADTEELLSRAKDQLGTPFSDTWNILNITKRVDATEEGLQKFAPAIEELAKDMAINEKRISNLIKGLSKSGINIEEEIENKKSNIVKMRDSERKLIDDANESETEEKSLSSGSSKNIFESEKNVIASDSIHLSAKGNLDNSTMEMFEKMVQKINSMQEELLELSASQKYILSFTEMLPVESITHIINEINEMKTKIEENSAIFQENAVPPDSDRLTELENQMKNQMNKMNDLNTNVEAQMESFQGQIADLGKESGYLLEKLNTGGGSGITDMASLEELYNKLQSIQDEIENLNETSNKLMKDQDEKRDYIEGLIEQVETMKIIKADKEAIEDALAEKADTLDVNGKVSHDQFDAVYNELNHSIIGALEKLGEQEKGWLKALNEIQRDIGSKLDRIEIGPLQDIIDSKIKNIQDHVKKLLIKRKEAEASGTKKKLLRNLNCISCDKRVAMNSELEEPVLPLPEPLPPTRSMRPFLTYELDNARRQQKRPPSRNLHHLENAMAEMKMNKGSPASSMKNAGHLCNRYCGGSHTVITNEQRVCRLGHFPENIILKPSGEQDSLGNVNKTMNQTIQRQ